MGFLFLFFWWHLYRSFILYSHRPPLESVSASLNREPSHAALEVF